LEAFMVDDSARQLLELYPRIFFACHTRHVRDPQTRRILSAHQASILDHLDEREPVTLLDLARHMGVTASTMSLHVERLVRRGYVLRERDSRDARRLRLRISASGMRIREANSVLDPIRVRAMLSRLSAEEREAGVRGLRILARAANEQVQEQSAKARRGRGRLPQ
jgi:MarR family transcriptional regulator, organic hydroperoxide resistance regulator